MASQAVNRSARVSDNNNFRAAFWPKKRKRQPKTVRVPTEKEIVRKYS